LVQVDFELLGHEHRESHHYALAHLGTVDEDGDGVVAANAHPGVHCGIGRGLRLAHYAGERHADDQRAAGGGARLEELAAGRILELGHDQAPFAALWIAARMRGYVPQRQMLPAMALSISASVGLGFSVRSAVADMIWPDWQ